MPDGPVLFEVRDNVAHVTLNHPQASNALDLEMAKQLMAVALRCEADRSVRAVLLTGAGKSFCAGGDVKVFVTQKELPAYLREITSYLHLAISRFAGSMRLSSRRYRDRQQAADLAWRFPAIW